MASSVEDQVILSREEFNELKNRIEALEKENKGTKKDKDEKMMDFSGMFTEMEKVAKGMMDASAAAFGEAADAMASNTNTDKNMMSSERFLDNMSRMLDIQRAAFDKFRETYEKD